MAQTLIDQNASAEQLEQQIQDAIEQARRACEANGDDSSECAVAWDTVEEMRAAIADRRQKTRQRNAFEEYCDENPDASECRVYDV